MIKVRDLNIYYGDKQVVRNINVDFPKNKIISIIGPSGCGKTTLLVSLNNIIKERGGRFLGKIEICGQNINDYTDEELRTKVGMVFQRPTPFPMSIRKNIELALNYHNMNYKSAVEDALIRVGLYDEVKHDLDSNATRLSGGQQQRLSIARSIAINPEVLLLDEPCSSLDVNSTKVIEDLLIKLKDDMTIIIVTHNLAEAKRISDYTLFMLNGEVVEYDKTTAIFNAPKDRRTRDYVGGLFG
ncbi:MAG: phosphate ABC transporter ATP-binding protein [Ezakiella sp.]|nr:phosphate ABC transporter ATP-binding protein [Ezakiella sp.]MDD7761263.1 phosphate ABC transporter ATP-binding protein [Bacillota bacterium]MDY3947566.1 phosphate ABC transporter ATP-binding protein [Ezakiella sp.]